MRLHTILGALAALAVALLIAAFTGTASIEKPGGAATGTPNSLVALSDVPLGIFPLPAGTFDGTSTKTATGTDTSTTSSPKPSTPIFSTPSKTGSVAPKKNTPTVTPTKVSTSTSTEVPTNTISTPVLPPPTPDPLITQAGLDSAATNLRSALVNIICISSASGIHSISGSGVIVDPKGIVLTNAHIAQYFLLNNFQSPNSVSCVIRTGTPAKTAYVAKLLYISPYWLRANSTVLSQAQPVGNGQYDFAFLVITGSTTNAALPTVFPSVPLATTPPSLGDPVVIGSYAAQFLTSNEIRSTLYQTVVFGSIKNVLTLGQNTVDVLSFGGTAAAQEGSSGGGAIDANGKLTGTITTSTVEGDTSTRELRAITASYIANEYAAETGSTLATLFSTPLLISISAFALQMPALEAIITSGLKN